MIELSGDETRLDRARVHEWLASSVWSPGVTREQVERQITNSCCVGAYDGGEQRGFARAVSDYASFAWIDDVWVDEAARGQGIGRAMVRWFLDHPSLASVRRFALMTTDAHAVYAEFGFHPLLRPARWMERVAPAFEARMGTIS